MDYSDSRFSKMQEDAIRRVQEMQRRSREAVGTEEAQDANPSSPATASLGKVIGDLHIDEEKALIAFLIYILYKQEADIKLMLGLAYLLL